MMGELIARNLLHRPLRTLIGVMAVAVEVALVVLIVGLTTGLLTETAKRIEGIGADIMLQPPAASIFIGLTRRNLMSQAVRYLLFGEGETGLMVYTILLRYWDWTPEADVRPLIFLMSD